MSYTDIICVFMCDDVNGIHGLAQEWLDDMAEHTVTYLVFRSIMVVS